MQHDTSNFRTPITWIAVLLTLGGYDARIMQTCGASEQVRAIGSSLMLIFSCVFKIVGFTLFGAIFMGVNGFYVMPVSFVVGLLLALWDMTNTIDRRLQNGERALLDSAAISPDNRELAVSRVGKGASTTISLLSRVIGSVLVSLLPAIGFLWAIFGPEIVESRIVRQQLADEPLKAIAEEQFEASLRPFQLSINAAEDQVKRAEVKIKDAETALIEARQKFDEDQRASTSAIASKKTILLGLTTERANAVIYRDCERVYVANACPEDVSGQSSKKDDPGPKERYWQNKIDQFSAQIAPLEQEIAAMEIALAKLSFRSEKFDKKITDAVANLEASTAEETKAVEARATHIANRDRFVADAIASNPDRTIIGVGLFSALEGLHFIAAENVVFLILLVAIKGAILVLDLFPMFIPQPALEHDLRLAIKRTQAQLELEEKIAVTVTERKDRVQAHAWETKVRAETREQQSQGQSTFSFAAE